MPEVLTSRKGNRVETKPKRVSFTVDMDETELNEFDYIAKNKDDRSRNSMVRILMKRYRQENREWAKENRSK